MQETINILSKSFESTNLNTYEINKYLNLPQDIWGLVFRQLTMHEWKNCLSLSKSFYQICFNKQVLAYVFEGNMPINKKLVAKRVFTKFKEHEQPFLALFWS